MKLIEVVTPPSIYHVDPLGSLSGMKIPHLASSHLWTRKIVFVAMLGNTGKSRMVRSTPPWTFIWNLVVWTRWKSHLQSQKNIREDQERDWLPLWVSITLELQRKTKNQGMPLPMSVWRIFRILSRNLKICLMRYMCGRGPNMNQATVSFI